MIDGVRVVHAPTRKYRGDSAGSYLQPLRRLLRPRDRRGCCASPRAFDLVQAHTMPEAVAFAATLQRLTGVPLLLDVHDLTRAAVRLEVPRRRRDDGHGAGEHPPGHCASRTRCSTVHEPVRGDDPAVDPATGEQS